MSIKIDVDPPPPGWWEYGVSRKHHACTVAIILVLMVGYTQIRTIQADHRLQVAIDREQSDTKETRSQQGAQVTAILETLKAQQDLQRTQSRTLNANMNRLIGVVDTLSKGLIEPAKKP